MQSVKTDGVFVKTKLLYALFLATCGFGAFWMYQQGLPFAGQSDDGSGSLPETHAAEHANSNRVVAALGRLEPRTEVIGLGASMDERLSRLLVSEGEFVDQGQVLAYLESFDERMAEKGKVVAQLDEARKLLLAETAHGEALIREVAIEITQIEKLQPLAIEAQEAKVRSAQVKLKNSRSELERKRILIKNRGVSEEEMERAELAVRQDEESLTSGQATLKQLRYQLELDRLMAQTKLQRAKAGLARSQAAIAVESLEKQIEFLESRIQRTMIRAPIDGQILEVLTWPGERLGNQPILQMGDTKEMHAVAEVYETDIGLVRLGQKATIRSPALPRELAGSVVRVGVQIYKNDILDVDPAADADARVVEVRIRLDEPDLVAGLSNLQVDVEIRLADAAIVEEEMIVPGGSK